MFRVRPACMRHGPVTGVLLSTARRPPGRQRRGVAAQLQTPSASGVFCCGLLPSAAGTGREQNPILTAYDSYALGPDPTARAVVSQYCVVTAAGGSETALDLQGWIDCLSKAAQAGDILDLA